MTALALTAARGEPATTTARAWPRVALLLAGFAAAVGVRVAVGRPQVSRSAPAGLLFAALLVLLTVLAGERLGFTWRSVALGAVGGLLLCVPVVARGLDALGLGAFGLGALGAHRPGGSFAGWAAVVTVVAVAEEVFLRGALFGVIVRARSEWWAIGVTAVAFGLLHVPLYGWGALPLDLAVGVWLGVLRALTGSVAAPAAAHVVADLAGWWLR